MKPKTTYEQLRPVRGVNCLYRHANGSYYGRKKVAGKRHLKALTTADGRNITERKIAEPALGVWIASLTAPAPTNADMTFRQLWDKFLASKTGKRAEGTIETYEWSAQCIDVDFPEAWKMRIQDFKPSHLSEFLARRWYVANPSSVKTNLSLHLKMVFEIAVADDID